jgi:hypothetical protein
MLGDPWFQELRWVRSQIDQLLRHHARGVRFSPSDEALYRSLCDREVELLRAIRNAVPAGSR